MGNITIAGLYEPGTVVELYQTPDARHLRVDATSSLRDRKQVAMDGTVVFRGCGADERFIARGYINGVPYEQRCHGIEEHEGSELAQAPVQRTPQPVGQSPSVPDPSLPPATHGQFLEVSASDSDVSISAAVDASPHETTEE